VLWISTSILWWMNDACHEHTMESCKSEFLDYKNWSLKQDTKATKTRLLWRGRQPRTPNPFRTEKNTSARSRWVLRPPW